MELTVKCQGCGSTIKAKDEWTGRVGKCPKCGGKVEFQSAELPAVNLGELAPPSPAAIAKLILAETQPTPVVVKEIRISTENMLWLVAQFWMVTIPFGILAWAVLNAVSHFQQ